MERQYTPSLECFNTRKPGQSWRMDFCVAQHAYWVQKHGDDFERRLLAVTRPVGERIEASRMTLNAMGVRYAAIVAGARAALAAADGAGE